MRQTPISWGSSKNTEKQMLPFAGQITHSCRPLCLADPHIKLFPGKWRRIQEKGAWFPDSKAKENGIWHATKMCVCVKIIFLLHWNILQQKVIYTTLSAVIYLSKYNLLYQSIFTTVQDIQNYPVVDTKGYLNPQLLNVTRVICMYMHKQKK